MGLILTFIEATKGKSGLRANNRTLETLSKLTGKKQIILKVFFFIVSQLIKCICMKCMKEWREVTFMKEWVKALYIGYHQELDLPKNLFPFPRTVQLKISLGPIRFLYSKFHGLLKLIFHTNQYNGA